MSDALRTPGALIGLALTAALLGLALFADVIAPGDPFASVAPPLSPPSRAHLMGSDDLGRDLLASVIHGARTSVVVSLGVTALAGFIGLGDPRAVSLGYLANNAQRFLHVAWWMALFPGAAIALAILALNLLGDALADLGNPRHLRGGAVAAR